MNPTDPCTNAAGSPECLLDMIWVSLPGGVADAVNASWREFVGLGNEAPENYDWRDALHPEDRERAGAVWKRVLGMQQCGEVEARIRRFDGLYKWFLIRVAPFFGANRAVAGWHGHATDIDELKCAQALLAGEKVLLEMIASGDSTYSFVRTMCDIVDRIAPDSLVTIGLIHEQGRPLTHTLSANLPQSFADGLDSKEFAPEALPCSVAMEAGKGLEIHDIEHECPWPAYRELALSHGIRACFITPILAPGGEVMGTFNMHALRPGEPTLQQRAIIEQFTHLIGVAVKRQRIDAALRASQERFALAAEASAEGIWDWDIEKNEMFISLRAQRIFGLDPGPTTRPREAWQEHIRVYSEDPAVELRLLDGCLDGKTDNCDGEWRIRLSDGGYRWIRLVALCLRDELGEPVRLAGSVSDIHTQKRIEAALEQSRRLEALGTLAGGIAHDFNNILGVILGYGEMAGAEAGKGTRLERNINRIMCAGERGRSLANRILNFSRSGMTEYSEVQVAAVVQEAIEMITENLPRNVTIESQVESGEAAILGDQAEVHQVAVNLMTNAMQAMPDGGTLSVHLNVKDVTDSLIATTGLVAPGPYIRLEVQDTGTGMGSEVMERIFDPFFTTKEFGVGTGIGLSLVHNIVTQLGGAIDVETELGRGSKFSIYLPHSGNAGPVDEVHADPLPRGKGERVLIVDDEEALLALNAEILSDLGYAPSAFTSGSRALKAFREDPEGFALVITDERMPVMSGSALIREIRKLSGSMPVILMSGFFGEAAPRIASEVVPDAVLRKPLLARDMAEAVSKALNGRTAST